MDYFLIIVLLAFSALFSGLTIGLFSLNKADLRRKAKLGNERAAVIYELRKKSNLLLTFIASPDTERSLFRGKASSAPAPPACAETSASTGIVRSLRHAESPGRKGARENRHFTN